MAKKRKFTKTREWLIEEYVIKNRSRKEVAQECGMTVSGLHSLLSYFGINKPKNEIKLKELKDLLEKGNSVNTIAKKLNSSQTVIYRLMKENGLKINYTPDFSQYDDSNDSLICSLYLDGFSTTEIAKHFSVTHRTILNHLKHNNVSSRNLQQAQFAKSNREIPKELLEYNTLYNLYIKRRLSKKDLGEMFNVCPRTIDTCLKNLNIPIRGSSESKIGISAGDRHSNWKGGITPLHLRLRESFGTLLVPKVLQRDHYTCQICGAKGKLHVHHIRHFSDIMRDVLEENSNLDPVKDINKLYDVAVKDSRLNDLNNLITCCPNCHYNIYHNKNN